MQIPSLSSSALPSLSLLSPPSLLLLGKSSLSFFLLPLSRPSSTSNSYLLSHFSTCFETERDRENRSKMLLQLKMCMCWWWGLLSPKQNRHTIHTCVYCVTSLSLEACIHTGKFTSSPAEGYICMMVFVHVFLFYAACKFIARTVCVCVRLCVSMCVVFTRRQSEEVVRSRLLPTQLCPLIKHEKKSGG